MNTSRHGSIFLVPLLVFLVAMETRAQDVAQVKVSAGAVTIERGGQRLPAPVGTRVRATDTIVTGADGSAGITFVDDSRLSVGRNSTLEISKFSFNPNTRAGTLDTTIKRGTLSVVSGQLAKQSPEAVTVRTPATILGVRGTEFVARAGVTTAAPKPVPKATLDPATAGSTISCDNRLLSCRPPASADFIVLLPGADGKTGAVAVRQGSSEVVLDSAYASASTSSDGGLKSGRSSAAEVKEEFGATLATAPQAPVSFIIYFRSGAGELAEDYESEVKRLFEELTRRPAPEITVIGHTDRVGTDKANDALGLQRAARVRQILVQRGVPARRVVAVSRGEREPLVPTADEVPEPRNRRVEMSVR